MKKRMLWLFVVLFTVLSPSTSFAQGREYIRNAIDRWGGCRNVAITKYNGDLALYGKNGFAVSDCPDDLVDAIDELNEDGEFIDDVQLTEAGRWLVLYGDNGIVWNNIPYSLENKLREYNNRREVITSVTFNDDGDWIVISTDYYSCSDATIQEFMAEGAREYGQIWAACITNDALVVVYEGGFRTIGNVPDSLRAALGKTTLDVFRLKIAGQAWFFADQEGRYQYSM